MVHNPSQFLFGKGSEQMKVCTMPSDITIEDIDGLLSLVADCVDDDQLVDVVALALSRLDLTKGSAA